MYLGCKNAASYFNDNDWSKVKYFYDIHLDGTEARHAEDLNKTVWKVLDNTDKKKLFFDGYNSFLHLQTEFWKGLEREIFITDLMRQPESDEKVY